MADVSVLKLDNTAYDIKDVTARTNYTSLSATVSNLQNEVDSITTMTATYTADNETITFTKS